MNSKKDIISFSIIAVLLVVGVASYFLFTNAGWMNSSPWDKAQNENTSILPADLIGIIEKKKNNEPLSPEEENVLDEVIKEKVKKRVGEIQKAAEGRSYTQEELNFIYNPSVIVKNELGID
ncbi:MAG: hypothetical protein WCW77_04080 [Patescibacteria group bacterium]|jgi:hypothetical protein